MPKKLAQIPDALAPLSSISALLRIAIFLGLCFLLGNYFFQNFDSGYWFDELYSLTSSYRSWDWSYLRDIAKDGIPLGHYVTLKMLTLPFAEKALVARILSGLFFFISVVFLVVNEKLSWRSLGVFLLICLSPGLLYFSTEIRPYAAKILFFFCSTYFFQKFLISHNEKQSQQNLLCWGLANFLGLSHHYTFLAVPVLHIFICYACCPKKLYKKDNILPIILSILPLLQLFLTDFSRFNPTKKESTFFFKVDWLIVYYRPGLNKFIWYYYSLIAYAICGYALLLLKYYRSKNMIPSWFSLVGLTGVGTFFISLLALPFIDTLYPRYQMFFYLGILFLIAQWMSHSHFAKGLFVFGFLLTLLTSIPVHKNENYLLERKFFKEVGNFIENQSDESLCIVTNGDWTLRYYIPTLSKIYHKPIQALSWQDRAKCKFSASFNLFHNYETLPGEVLYRSDLWSLSSEQSL